MKRLICLFAVALLILSGCSTKTSSESVPMQTEETLADLVIEDVQPTVEINISDTSITADFWGEQKVTHDGKTIYTYSIYVNSDDIYATPDNNCVYILNGNDYISAQKYNNEIEVKTKCVNEGYGNGTSAFVKISSPTILDVNKIFISIVGTKEYKPGMSITTKEDYISKYGEETLYEGMLAISQIGLKDSEKLFSKDRPVYESLRMVNRGDGYDLIFISTKDTKAELKDNILWTPVSITYMTDCNYNDEFNDILNNTYVAKADSRGTYQDIQIIKDSDYEVLTKVENNKVYVGIKANSGKPLEGDKAPNCVLGNIVLKDDETSITSELAQKTVIIFFN